MSGPPTLVEVDVDVGHGDAIGVQEALEQQSVLQRIQFGDAQGVGDHRARGRSTTRTHADAVLLGVAHEVGDD